MEFPSGKGLTVLALALIVVAAAAAARIASSAGFRETPGIASSAGPSAEGSLARARDAERKGDLTEALAQYRAAVERRPRIVDRRSPEYLGPEFEGKVRTWVSELRKGKISAGPTALPDASYLFRRMYGGCG